MAAPRAFLVCVALAACAATAAHGDCQGVLTSAGVTGPSPRSGVSAAYDSARERVVVFGGNAAAGRFGDTWAWDGAAWIQIASTGPSPRAFHALAYDPLRDRLVLVGGLDTQFRGDTWEFDGVAWSLRATTGPPARAFASLAYDAGRQRIVLFGGLFGVSLGDTWEWDGAAWTQLSSVGPPARYNAAMAYDASRGRLVLFGGADVATPQFADTWAFEGGAWTPICAAGAPGRFGHTLSYDSERARLVAFGGQGAGGVALGDAWELIGAEWAPAVSLPAAARSSHAAAFDAARARLVIFGGQNPALLGDTWRMQGAAPPAIVAQPMRASVLLDQTAVLSVSIAGVGPFAFQWRRDGAPLANDGRVSGATAPLLSVANATADDVAAYDCVITSPCGQVRSDPAVIRVRAAQGDLNCDGRVDNFDVDPFVVALLDPATFAQLYPLCP